MEATGAQHNADLSARETAVTQRETELSTLEATLAQREAELSAREATLAQREAELSALADTLAQREAELTIANATTNKEDKKMKFNSIADQLYKNSPEENFEANEKRPLSLIQAESIEKFQNGTEEIYIDEEDDEMEF